MGKSRTAQAAVHRLVLWAGALSTAGGLPDLLKIQVVIPKIFKNYPQIPRTSHFTELNRGGANIRWIVYPDAHHGFDGSTPRTYFPQGITAKNCSIEVFLTDVQGSGLGEARNYKTGLSIQGFGEWNQAFAACNSRGFTVAENRNAREQAVKEVLAFIQLWQVVSPDSTAPPDASANIDNEQRTEEILRELAGSKQ